MPPQKSYPKFLFPPQNRKISQTQQERKIETPTTVSNPDVRDSTTIVYKPENLSSANTKEEKQSSSQPFDAKTFNDYYQETYQTDLITDDKKSLTTSSVIPARFILKNTSKDNKQQNHFPDKVYNLISNPSPTVPDNRSNDSTRKFRSKRMVNEISSDGNETSSSPLTLWKVRQTSI